ncbi:MAG: hypothetical protein V4539_11335 [Bacteroidota bacterium]
MNTKIQPAKNNSLPGIISFCIFAILVFFYCWVAYTSFGYDDEYYNIRVVSENGLGDLIKLVQTTDIHPPLHYIINWLLFHVFHSWALVRVFSALLYLCSLLFLVSKTQGETNKLLLVLLLGLNPTILLWCTSIRWYAYATPLLLILSVTPDWKKKGYWWYFFLLFLVLCYLGYAGFILSLPYFLLYWQKDLSSVKTKIRRILFPALTFGIAYSYQLLIFLKVHTQTKLSPDNEQSFDIKTSLLSFISSDFSNQGVFPISIGGIISILGSAILFLASLFYFKTVIKKNNWTVFSLSALLFIVIGIAGKIRNLVLLEPSRNLFFTDLLSVKKNKVIAGALYLVLAGNLIGVYNIFMHEGTTKNAWNLPLRKTMDRLKGLEKKGDTEIYFTHNPTFTYYLTEENKNLVSFYNTLYFDSARIKTNITRLSGDSQTNTNLTFILTYRGKSIPVEHYAKMINAMNAIKADSVVRLKLGRDKDYTLKKRFFPDYPEFTVEIIKFYKVNTNLKQLASWEYEK